MSTPEPDYSLEGHPPDLSDNEDDTGRLAQAQTQETSPQIMLALPSPIGGQLYPSQASVSLRAAYRDLGDSLAVARGALAEIWKQTFHPVLMAAALFFYGVAMVGFGFLLGRSS